MTVEVAAYLPREVPDRMRSRENPRILVWFPRIFLSVGSDREHFTTMNYRVITESETPEIDVKPGTLI